MAALAPSAPASGEAAALLAPARFPGDHPASAAAAHGAGEAAAVMSVSALQVLAAARRIPPAWVVRVAMAAQASWVDRRPGRPPAVAAGCGRVDRRPDRPVVAAAAAPETERPPSLSAAMR